MQVTHTMKQRMNGREMQEAWAKAMTILQNLAYQENFNVYLEKYELSASFEEFVHDLDTRVEFSDTPTNWNATVQEVK